MPFSDGGVNNGPIGRRHLNRREIAVAHLGDGFAGLGDVVLAGGRLGEQGGQAQGAHGPDQALQEERPAGHGLARVLPVVEMLADLVDVPISVDTFRADVATGAEALAARMRRETRLPVTIMVIGSSQLLALAIALPVGVYAATKPYSLFDQISSTFAFIGFSLPTFFTGLLLILVFSVQLDWLPTSGRGGAERLQQHVEPLAAGDVARAPHQQRVLAREAAELRRFA